MSKVNEKKELDEVEVKVEVEVFEPTYQQNLVIRCLKELFDATRKASVEHDRRAEKITAITGGVVAFLGGASALPGANLAAQPCTAVSLVVVFFLAAMTLRGCAVVWGPTTILFPTTPDAMGLYDDYIKQDVFTAFNQHLASLASCASKNCEAVEAKAVSIDRVMRMVQLQAFAVAAVVIFKALQW